MFYYIYHASTAAVLSPQEQAIRSIKAEKEKYERGLKNGIPQNRSAFIKKIREILEKTFKTFTSSSDEFLKKTFFTDEEIIRPFKERLSKFIKNQKIVQKLKPSNISRSTSFSNEEQLKDVFKTVIGDKWKGDDPSEKYATIETDLDAFLQAVGVEETNINSSSKKSQIETAIKILTEDSEAQKAVEKETLEQKLASVENSITRINKTLGTELTSENKRYSELQLEAKKEERDTLNTLLDSLEAKKEKELERAIAKKTREIESGTTLQPRVYHQSYNTPPSLKASAESYWNAKLQKALEQDMQNLTTEKEALMQEIKKLARKLLTDHRSTIDKAFSDQDLSESTLKELAEKITFEELFDGLQGDQTTIKTLRQEFMPSSYSSRQLSTSHSSNNLRDILLTLTDAEKKQPINILKIAYNALSPGAKSVVDSGRSISQESLDKLNEIMSKYDASKKIAIYDGKELTLEIDKDMLEAALFYEVIKKFKSSLPALRSGYILQSDLLAKTRAYHLTNDMKSRVERWINEVNAKLKQQLTEDTSDTIGEDYNDSVTALPELLEKLGEENHTKNTLSGLTLWQEKYPSIYLTPDGESVYKIIKEEEIKSVKEKEAEKKKEEEGILEKIGGLQEEVKKFVEGSGSEKSTPPATPNPLAGLLK